MTCARRVLDVASSTLRRRRIASELGPGQAVARPDRVERRVGFVAEAVAVAEVVAPALLVDVDSRAARGDRRNTSPTRRAGASVNSSSGGRVAEAAVQPVRGAQQHAAERRRRRRLALLARPAGVLERAAVGADDDLSSPTSTLMRASGVVSSTSMRTGRSRPMRVEQICSVTRRIRSGVELDEGERLRRDGDASRRRQALGQLGRGLRSRRRPPPCARSARPG